MYEYTKYTWKLQIFKSEDIGRIHIIYNSANVTNIVNKWYNNKQAFNISAKV